MTVNGSVCIILVGEGLCGTIWKYLRATTCETMDTYSLPGIRLEAEKALMFSLNSREGEMRGLPVLNLA